MKKEDKLLPNIIKKRKEKRSVELFDKKNPKVKKLNIETPNPSEAQELTDIKDYKERAKRLALKQDLSATATDAAKRGDVKTLKKINKIAKKFNIGKAAKKVGKKLLGAVPFVGGLASAIATKDASAAIPGDISATGPGKGTPSSVIENPDSTPAQRKAAIKELLKKRAKGN